MNTLQKTKFIRDARIKALRSVIQLHSMDKQETLGLENLGLEMLVAPRKASRADRGKTRRVEVKASLQPELQQASEQHTSHISSWDPFAVPSYEPLPIVPLGSSANIINHWPLQMNLPGFVSRYHPVQVLVSTLGPPNVSMYQPGQGNGPSSVPRVAAIPSVQPRLPSAGLGPTVQQFTLSVLTCHSLPSTLVDKQYRYSKANPPLTKATPVPRGRWIGSPPANLRKAVSQPNRSSKLTKSRDLEATPPAIIQPSPSIGTSKGDLIHLPAPAPTSVYLSDANAIPNLLSSPQRLLLVLDLNGTLLYRPRASQNYTPRPCLLKFLKYAFANHSVLVWSSAQPYNVKGVCTRLFSRDQREMLLGEWGRDTLGLTSAQYRERIQVYKRLDRIWGNTDLQHSHPDFERGERWGQHNTVLIDDSALKASAQPFNHITVPEFVRGGGEQEGDGRDVLGQVVAYLEEARKWSNVSRFVRHVPFKIDVHWC
ncbi:MAG: hypothetical protein Q9175_006427 [Cornicularia normoerica]